MNQVQLGFEPLAEGYDVIYQSLCELRESFHRSGRLDDSNAKLDEVTKLFATYLAYRRRLIPNFPERDDPKLIAGLQSAFSQASKLDQYRDVSGSSIFGTDPRLALRSGDDGLARDLVALVKQCVDTAFDLRVAGKAFDVLNEAFGHFVRDNFRGNIEDAQYMTPPEVVDFVVGIALESLQSDDSHDSQGGLTVLDPTCGVGSFLSVFYHRAVQSGVIDYSLLRLFGQDKVERMVRLATINLELFHAKDHRIFSGNSLVRGAAIDSLNDSVDLILTNPPFGARFDARYVKHECGDNTPFFGSHLQDGQTVDSELLFIDRNIRLLKDGGRMLIVVPDGVVSGKGMAARLRQSLASRAQLQAIIELPSVTFAQAGTRTKTVVLYVKKARSPTRGRVFMSVVGDLGFQVVSRKGVQIKHAVGENQLPEALRVFRRFDPEATPTDAKADVLADIPSCVSVAEREIIRGSWTPRHYSATRLLAIGASAIPDEVHMVPLSELVDFCSSSLKTKKWREGMAYLSVLHVLGEGQVDVGAALAYAPKTPGVPLRAGDLLLSKINPRIPRVCIAPDFGVEALCSSEFEVMRSRGELGTYALAYLLLTDAVQAQIRSLTSGTSASHNRIRTSELSSVLIPVPKAGSQIAEALEQLETEYRDALGGMARAAQKIALLRKQEGAILYNTDGEKVSGTHLTSGRGEGCCEAAEKGDAREKGTPGKGDGGN